VLALEIFILLGALLTGAWLFYALFLILRWVFVAAIEVVGDFLH